MAWKQMTKGSGFELWEHSYKAGQFYCRTIVVKFPDRYLVYSAGIDLAESFQKQFLVSSNTPIFLICPNHWHHMGVKGWKEKFPQAQVFAHPNAIPRLKRQGHRELYDITDFPIAPLKITCLQDSKTGEVWIEGMTDKGYTWVVTDAFFNIEKLPPSRIFATVLKMLRTGPGLCISRLYLWTSVKNRQDYKTWLLKKIRNENPAFVVVNHGKFLEGNIEQKLIEVIERCC